MKVKIIEYDYSVEIHINDKPVLVSHTISLDNLSDLLRLLGHEVEYKYIASCPDCDQPLPMYLCNDNEL